MTSKRGFTLIEIMIALVILVVTIIGLASATGLFIRQVAEDDREIAGIQLAEDRIETILMNPNFMALDTAYAGTEASFPGLPGYVRVTTITLVGGPTASQHHKRIAVTVTGPGLLAPIKRSATVAAP